MTRTTHGSLTLTLVPLLFVAGCVGGEIGGALEDVGGIEQGTTTMNALTMNALTMNALTMNALTMNGESGEPSVGDDARRLLVAHPLTGAQLMSAESAAVMSALSNPEPTEAPGAPTRGQLAVDLLEYIYSCAMPLGASTTLTGVAGQPEGVVKLHGQLGLADEWATGPCRDACRELVSACVLARVNAFGEPVEISMRAPAYGLEAGAEEREAFPDHEGAFYGNLFGRGEGSSWTGDWEAYACHHTSSLSETELVAVTHRACARPGGYCPIRVLGACGGLCAPDEDGYASCSNPEEPRAYKPVAVYLKPAEPVCGNAICEAGESADCPVDCADAFVMPVSSPGFSARVVASVAHPAHRSSSVIVLSIVEAADGQPAALNVGDGVTLPKQSPRDMVLVRYEAQEGAEPETIQVVWAVREPIPSEPGPGGALPLDPAGLTVDPDGDVAVAGTGFVALYDKDTGARVWRTVDAERVAHDSVWVNPVGDVVASGVKLSNPGTRVTTRYTVLAGQAFAHFNSAPIPGRARWIRNINSHEYEFYEILPGAGFKLRLRRLSSDGAELGAYDIQTPGIDQPIPTHLVADSATGNIVIAGYDAADDDPGRTPFIAQLTPSGSLSWLNAFRSQHQRKFLIERLQLHDGRIYIAGEFSGPTDFKGWLGGTPITPAFDISDDGFVARYDFGTGRAEWARTYGGNGRDSLGSFNVDGAGKLWTFGEFSGAARVDWKQIDGSNDGGSDLFIERSYPSHNLALHRPVQQSSTYISPEGVTGIASKAVDGDTNGDFASGSVAATNAEPGATWQVDLGGIRWVDHVLIYTRTDCCGEDQAGLLVQASGTGNADSDFGTKYVHNPDPQHPTGRVIRADNLGNIRYLRILQGKAAGLSLAEVQVWGH